MPFFVRLAPATLLLAASSTAAAVPDGAPSPPPAHAAAAPPARTRFIQAAAAQAFFFMRLHRWLHLDPAAWRPLPFSPPPCLCLLQPSTAIRPLPPRFFFSPSPCRAASALSSASRFVLLFIIVASLLPTAGAAAGTAAAHDNWRRLSNLPSVVYDVGPDFGGDA